MWEVFTFGSSPYPDVSNNDLLTFLDEGKRMDRPEFCPVEMYEIMLECWQRNPYERPEFGQMKARIGRSMTRQNASIVSYDMHLGWMFFWMPPTWQEAQCILCCLHNFFCHSSNMLEDT